MQANSAGGDEMTESLDKIIEQVCPWWIQKIPSLYRVFRMGFVHGLAWFFTHEKIRHEEDIRAIEEDLKKLGNIYHVDLSTAAYRFEL